MRLAYLESEDLFTSNGFLIGRTSTNSSKENLYTVTGQSLFIEIIISRILRLLYFRGTRLNFYDSCQSWPHRPKSKVFFNSDWSQFLDSICTSSKSDFLLWYFSFSNGYFSNHTFAEMKKVRMFFTFDTNSGQGFTDSPSVRFPGRNFSRIIWTL